MKLIDTNRYYLKGTQNRFVHIATVLDGLHEYICFVDMKTNQCYIEEMTLHGLEYIADDNLANEVKLFLDNHEKLDMKTILLNE